MSPSKRLDFQTLFEVFQNPFEMFGCKAFAHIPKDERIKLDAKSIKCIFIGYYPNKKSYKLFDPSSHKLFASKDVVFHENVDKIDKMNDTGIWHIFRDNDNYVKIEAVVKHDQNMNKNMVNNKMKTTWTLQAIMIHQVEKSHHKEERWKQ
jgi:hypothetical protein